jgi:hypothetical protein
MMVKTPQHSIADAQITGNRPEHDAMRASGKIYWIFVMDKPIIDYTGAICPEAASFNSQVQEGTTHHYRLILNIAESHIHDLYVRPVADQVHSRNSIREPRMPTFNFFKILDG